MIFLNKKSAKRIHAVNFDTYGNAIPNVPSLQKEGSSVAATIVETRDIVIKPRKKEKNKLKQKALIATSRDLLSRLLPSVITKPESKHLLAKLDHSNAQQYPLEKAQYISKQEMQPQVHNISEFIELSFKRLNNEFDKRDRQLEQRFLSLEQHNKRATKTNRRWLIPAALMGSIAGGYMLYVLTSMEGSMTLMASNIPVMGQHMGAMAGDMQNMNQSVGALNNNVASMNEQMGSISQSIEPMGKAASTAQPFMGMMRSFFPF